jgi:drug/metabolite transporter (DMT)-like permease
MALSGHLLGLSLGAMASVCWGFADFIARGATRKTGEHTTLLSVLTIGGIGIIFYTLPRGLTPLTAQSATLIFSTALVTVFGYLSLYRAFKVGMLSVVSGIASCNAIIPVILALVLLGERPLPWQYAGICVVLVGVVLLSMGKKATLPSHTHELGVGPAVIAMLLFGTGLFGMKLSVDLAGPETVALLVRLIGIGILIAWIGVSGRLAMPAADVRPALLAAGLLDAAAFIFFCEALTHTLLSLVAPISSTIPVVTVGLAYFLLHERLHLGQWIGLGLALAGITLVAIS